MNKIIYNGPAIGLYDPFNFQRYMGSEGMETFKSMSNDQGIIITPHNSGWIAHGMYLNTNSGIKVSYLMNLDTLVNPQITAKVALFGNDNAVRELEKRIRISAVVEHAPAIQRHIFDLVREAD